MISNAFAMAAPQKGADAPGGGLGGMLIPLVVIFGIFYFLIIRPQKRRETDHRKFLEAIQKGDEVVTQAGIYGKVSGLTDRIVTLEVADKVRIRIARHAIAGTQQTQQPEQR